MYDEIRKIISTYEQKGDFTYVLASSETINTAEQTLKVTIPEQYQWFLKNYGYGGIGGIEILGLGKNGKSIFVEETIKYRKYGLSHELILIENCDEWLYCINSLNGHVVMWSVNNRECDLAYDNFIEYMMDRMRDAIDNL